MDDETDQTDNRGGGVFVVSGYPWAWVTADTNGSAGAAYRVSLNPGDNYRALAGLHAGEIMGYYAKQDDGELARLLDLNGDPPPANRYTQDLLTVWRRFHVECDSMQQISPSEDVLQGQITSTGPGEAWIHPIAGDVATVTNRFAPGILRDPFVMQYWIYSSTAGDPFRVYFIPSLPVIPVGRLVTVYDDDFDLSTNPPAWRNLLPQTPDLSVITSAYSEAYVVADNESGRWNDSDRDGEVYFQEEIKDEDRDNHEKGSRWYWIGFVLNAFQLVPSYAADPDALAPVGGTPVGGGPSLVYLETLRDRNAAQGRSVSAAQVGAHELTHQRTGDAHANTVRTIVQVTDASHFKVSGNILETDGLLIDEGSWIRINPSDTGYKAWGLLLSFANNADNTCSITMTELLSPAPSVNDTCEINSLSILGARAGDGDVLCPWTIDRVRKKSESPLE